MRVIKTGWSRPKRLWFKPFAILIIIYQSIKQRKLCPYSHNFQLLEGGYVYQASHGEVNKVRLEDFLKDNKIVSIESFPVEDHTYDRVQGFLTLILGRKYGWASIVGIALNELFGIKWVGDDGGKRFICSEIGFKMLMEMGYEFDSDIIPDFVDPAMLRELAKKAIEPTS